MYSKEFKKEILEEFKRYPYFSTVAKRNGVSLRSLHIWVKKENIDVEALKKEIPEKKMQSLNRSKVVDKEMYETITIKEETANKIGNQPDKDETIEFTLNGYDIKIARKEIKEFIKEITND